MESNDGRKRTLDESDVGVASAAKRLAIEKPVDFLNADSLRTIRKDAIMREMRLYKQKLSRSDEKLAKSEKERLSSEALLVDVLAAWKTLSQLLYSTLSASNMEDLPEYSGIDAAVLERSVEERQSAIDSALQVSRKYLSIIPRILNYSQLDSNGDFAARLDEIVKENGRLSVELQKVKLGEQTLIQKLSDTESIVDALERRLQRERSAVIPIIKETAMDNSLESTTDKQDHPVEKSSESLNIQEPVGQDQRKLLAAIEEFKEKVEILESRVGELERINEELRHERASLSQQLDRATVDLQLLPEHVVVETGPYKHLQQSFSNCQEDLISLRAEHEAIQTEVQELQSGKKEHADRLEEEEKTRKHYYESEIKKMQSEISRIRTARDSVNQKYDLLEASESKKDESIARLESLIKSLRAHIRFLTEGIERSKLKDASSQGDSSLYWSFAAAVDLRLKEMEVDEASVDEYVTSIQVLRKELEKKTIQESALEGLSTGDGKLAVELEQTRSELSFLKQKLDSLQTKDGDVVDLDQIHKNLASSQQAEQMALSEMEAIASNYTTLESRCAELDELLTAKEEEIARLVQERVRKEQKISSAVKEKDNCNNKVLALEKKSQKQADLIKQLETNETSRGEYIRSMEKEVALSRNAVSQHQAKVQEILKVTNSLNAKLEKNSSKYQELLSMLKEKDGSIQKLEAEKQDQTITAKKLAIKLKHMNKRLQSNLFTNGEETGSAGDDGALVAEDELEVLRGYKKIAQCSVCEFRIKSHVLMKCMHVFCKECIDTRLETRQRKCPQCGLMFGPNDVKPIYI